MLGVTLGTSVTKKSYRTKIYENFRGYFLGTRAVLEILFKFAKGMESGRKNEGFILNHIMQFKAF